MIDFTDLLILMVVIWTAGKIFRALNLPVIFGELIGGIIVGPLLFNLVHVDSELIKVVAEFGIFFLMLHTGLQSKPEELMRAGRKSILIALGGGCLITLPVSFVEGWLMVPGTDLEGYASAGWTAFVVAAFTEELFKFLALMILF